MMQGYFSCLTRTIMLYYTYTNFCTPLDATMKPQKQKEMSKMFKRKPITREEKIAALKEAVRLWNIGKYSRAVDLYKRYEITDKEFTRALHIVRNQERRQK